MGTRNLTAVFHDGKFKVCQYGQWDGYPSVQGATVLNFLTTLFEKESFLSKLENGFTPITYEECEKLFNTPEGRPFLTRDTAAGILEIIQCSNGKFPLVLSEDFFADSLFCEWAYVIDLDKNELQVYKGLNKEKFSKSDRFYYLEKKARAFKNGYHPVKLLKRYSLSDLPTVEVFVAELDPPTPEE